MRKRVLTKLLCHAVLIAGAGIMVFPFFWMISTSLKTGVEAQGAPQLLPETLQWGNYQEMWRSASVSLGAERSPVKGVGAWLRRALWQPLGRSFVNSFLVALCVTTGVLFTSLLAGYAFGRMRFKGQRAIFVAFLATMMIPFEVTMLPNFLTVLKLGWYDKYPALIVPWTANVFSIFLMRQFFRQIPRDFYDAAQIDGCGHWRFLWRVGLPMVGPAVATIGIFSFLGSWNAFLWPLVVTSPENTNMRVVQYALQTFSRGDASTEYHLQMAAATAVILPIVVTYLFLQRRFVEGVAGTGLKG